MSEQNQSTNETENTNAIETTVEKIRSIATDKNIMVL